MARVSKDRTIRREELLDAATSLFAERGVADTAVSDIVGAVGVSQGTFYWYFESKEAIVDAVVERVSDRIVSAVEAIAAGPGTRAIEKLLAMRDATMASVRDDRELLEFFHRTGNEAFHDHVSRESVRRIVPAFEKVIEQGIAEGDFRIQHSDDAARFIAALMDVTDPFDAFAEPERLAHHIEALTEFALRGLGCEEETVAKAMARRVAGD